jgi:endonuclease-3
MGLYYILAKLLNILKTMNKETIAKIFQRFQKANPHPTTELCYSTPFELLIAVILSAQATDNSVNKATVVLFKSANSPEKIAKLGEAGLKQYIKSIGLYNSKASNIIKTCQMLIEKHHSKVPHDREALEALPGVGRKTANVILNTCFGEPTIAVDTPLEVERKLLKVIPKKYLHDAHHWLILHGRYICVARKPRCPECLIRDLCQYKFKTVEA